MDTLWMLYGNKTNYARITQGFTQAAGNSEEGNHGRFIRLFMNREKGETMTVKGNEQKPQKRKLGNRKK